MRQKALEVSTDESHLDPAIRVTNPFPFHPCHDLESNKLFYFLTCWPGSIPLYRGAFLPRSGLFSPLIRYVRPVVKAFT